jgi:glutamate formiminotransferase
MVRERDGGMPGVRALGFRLPDADCAQVSMNLTDLDRTGMQAACLQVRGLARGLGTDVSDVELVGLVARRELERCSHDFLTWSRIDSASTIEARIGHGPRWSPGEP